MRCGEGAWLRPSSVSARPRPRVVGVIRLSLAFSGDDASPRELRARFALALREAILRAALTGRVDLAHAEEFWRAVPDPEHA
jgi:hypothetical protein